MSLLVTAVFVSGTFVVFHTVTTLYAELTHFRDRRFMRDWYNCTDIADFWRRWNVHVHTFYLRHLTRPAVSLVR